MPSPHDLKPVTRCCVAEGKETQGAVREYKRIYLCNRHRAIWDAAQRRGARA